MWLSVYQNNAFCIQNNIGHDASCCKGNLTPSLKENLGIYLSIDSLLWTLAVVDRWVFSIEDLSKKAFLSAS
jgi:hypothetical protein